LLTACQRGSLPAGVIAGQNAFADPGRSAPQPIGFCPDVDRRAPGLRTRSGGASGRFTLLTSDVSVASKATAEKRLYRTLLLAEKLPSSAAFAPQIARDIDRQTLHVAYLAKYPQRAREILHLALVGVLALVVLAGYYVLLAGDATS
jgi:hypothetical protein